jgi:hypothetical protein
MILLYVHAGLMCTGFLFLLMGFAVVRFMKRKTWWLKIHKLLAIPGASCAVLGFCAVVLDIALAGGQHLRTPHSYIGVVVVILIIAAPVLGFMQFRFRQHVRAIKGLHIWSGRIVLILMLINIMLGLY